MVETLKYKTETKAIKNHKCNFCGGEITKGDIYHKSTHKFDGEVYDWKTHTICSDIANKLNMYDDTDYGLTQEIFVETINEVYYRIDPPSQTKTTFNERLNFVINNYEKDL